MFKRLIRWAYFRYVIIPIAEAEPEVDKEMDELVELFQFKYDPWDQFSENTITNTMIEKQHYERFFNLH